MNLRIRNGKYCSRQLDKDQITNKYQGYDDNLSMEEYENLLFKLITECLRISKVSFINIQMLTGNKRALFSILGEFNKNIKEVIIWDKMHGRPAIKAKVLNSRYEFLLVLTNESDAMSREFLNAQLNRGTLDNVWEIRRGKKIDKSHGATFPEELIEKIILNFSKKGDIILDPMMGTGTTGVVSVKNDRQFIGIELLESYFKICHERMQNIKK